MAVNNRLFSLIVNAGTIVFFEALRTLADRKRSGANEQTQGRSTTPNKEGNIFEAVLLLDEDKRPEALEWIHQQDPTVIARLERDHSVKTLVRILRQPPEVRMQFLRPGFLANLRRLGGTITEKWGGIDDETKESFKPYQQWAEKQHARSAESEEIKEKRRKIANPLIFLILAGYAIYITGTWRMVLVSTVAIVALGGLGIVIYRKIFPRKPSVTTRKSDERPSASADTVIDAEWEEK
ncbi:MAG: hypothetical protein Q8Q94_01570 [bacterium]|nr:hypothetical protein [bacterium]